MVKNSPQGMVTFNLCEITLICCFGIIAIMFILIADYNRFKKEILYIRKRDFRRLARHQSSRFHPVECYRCKSRDGRWYWSREHVKHCCLNHEN